MWAPEEFPDTNSEQHGRLKASWPDFGQPVVKPAAAFSRWVVFHMGQKIGEYKSEEAAMKVLKVLKGNLAKPWKGKTHIKHFGTTEDQLLEDQAKARANNRWQGGWGA